MSFNALSSTQFKHLIEIQRTHQYGALMRFSRNVSTNTDQCSFSKLNNSSILTLPTISDPANKLSAKSRFP